jgi:hypothetical protein
VTSILMNMDRIRELEIRIEKLKNKLEDIDGKLDRIQLVISSTKGRPSKLNLAAVLLGRGHSHRHLLEPPPFGQSGGH